jgi:hypothetical protein
MKRKNEPKDLLEALEEQTLIFCIDEKKICGTLQFSGGTPKCRGT